MERVVTGVYGDCARRTLARWLFRWGVAGWLRSDLRTTAGDVGAEAGTAGYDDKECFAIVVGKVVAVAWDDVLEVVAVVVVVEVEVESDVQWPNIPTPDTRTVGTSFHEHGHLTAFASL